MENIAVSIIVPVFNVEKYLDRCMQSIVNQTLKNIEIILINDGSTDSSLDIINEYSKGHENIIILNQKNEGQGKARNKAIEIAKGNYIGFIDADDYVDINMYENMINKAYKEDADIVTCGYYQVNDYDSSIISKNILDEGAITKEACISNCINGKLSLAVWNKIFRRKFIQDNNLSFIEGRYYEDMYMCIKAVISAKKIYNVGECYYKYVNRNGSTVKQRGKRYLDDYIFASSEIRKLLKNENNYIQNYFMQNEIVTIMSFLSKDNRNLLIKKNIGDYIEGKVVAIFGASQGGEIILDGILDLNTEDIFFCDNDNNKVGRKIGNFNIFKPEHLNILDKNKLVIIIGSMYFGEIYSQLVSMKLQQYVFMPSVEKIEEICMKL